MDNSSKPRRMGREPMKPLKAANRKARTSATEGKPTRIPSSNAIPPEERMLPKAMRGGKRRSCDGVSADGPLVRGRAWSDKSPGWHSGGT